MRPAPTPLPTPDHRIVRARRQTTIAVAHFERDLDELLLALHELREELHGHPLPYPPPDETGHQAGEP